MTSGDLFSFLGTPDNSSADALENSIRRDSNNNIVDAAVSKKLFQFWTHVLGKQLTDEQKTLFKLFDVTEQPDSEEDNVKYISALNIASSSTLYLRIMKVVGSLMSTGLPFVIKLICSSLANKFTASNEDAKRFIELVEQKLSDLSFSTTDSKELTNEVISYKARECFENAKNNRSVNVKSISPYLSMISRIMERLAAFCETLLTSSRDLTHST
ncbi:hypothetical protein HDE_12490 [Halotydeus destructor]|nr:hypothetical protein HDE_12490 [Halotydeus destructor]